MLDEERHASLVEIIESLLERNALEGIEPTSVSFLELFGESLVGIVGPGDHVKGDSDGRGDNCSGEDGGNFSVPTVLEASKVVGPS